MKKVLLLLTVALGFNSFAQLPIDTAGLSTWSPNKNSWTNWDVGSFNSGSNGSQTDMGWGVYNMNTHHVNGDSIYIIKLMNDTYKQVFVEKLANGKYTFHYANLDGSNVETVEINKQDFSTKNFGYYSIQEKETKNNLEPATADWDLVFTKYNRASDGYPVTGVLTNKKIKVAEAKQQDTANVTPSSLTYNQKINTIGYDWKKFNMGTFSYDIADSLSYYLIEGTDTSVIVFHGFSGSSGGGVIKFTVNGKMKQVTMGTGYTNRVFFDLKNDSVFSSPRKNWDLAFGSGQMSATIRTNETEGVNLWVYKKADKKAWLSIKDINSPVSVFRIFPNPTRNVCNIDIGGNKNGTIQMQIIDVSGRILVQKKLSVYSGMSNHTIDISHFNAGIFHVVLQDQNGNTWNQRLIKK